jgi:ribonuclease P protein component
LLSAREFQKVYQRGGRSAGAWITVVALRRPDQQGARLGVSVSKDHGAAVRRNKIKRLLREAFRHERAQLPAMDYILIPRQREEKFTLAALRSELSQLAQRIASGKGARRSPRPSEAP